MGDMNGGYEWGIFTIRQDRSGRKGQDESGCGYEILPGTPGGPG